MNRRSFFEKVGVGFAAVAAAPLAVATTSPKVMIATPMVGDFTLQECLWILHWSKKLAQEVFYDLQPYHGIPVEHTIAGMLRDGLRDGTWTVESKPYWDLENAKSYPTN
jgi:hypothetical protein